MLAQRQILSQLRVDDIWQVLGEFCLPATAGLERQALERVGTVIEPLNLAASAIERVRSAVSTAAGNTLAAAHSPGPRLPITFRVLAASDRARDESATSGGLGRQGAGRDGPEAGSGCGFFGVQKLANRWPTGGGVVCHTIEVFLCPTGACVS